MRLLVGSLLALSLIGCGYGRSGNVNSPGAAGFALGVGMLAGAAIAASHERPREEPVVIYNTYYVNGPMPTTPPVQPFPKDRIPEGEQLPAFDPNAARSALNGIDVSSCRASGAPRGYGHAKVVWNPDGTISKVVVDEPSGLSAEAAKCVGDRLGTATVPAFRGSLVTVGTTWYVP